MIASWQLGPILRGIRGHRAAATLVVVQLGIGLALTILSVLIGDYFYRRGTPSADFVEDELSIVAVQLPGRSAGAELTVQRRAQLLATVRATPGCVGATTLQALPLGVIDRVPDVVRRATGAAAPSIPVYSLDGGAGVAQVAGLELRAGRDFVPDDLVATGPTAAIVSRRLARELWRDAEPIGASFASRTHGPAVVVGVVDGMRTQVFGQDLPEVLYARGDDGAARLMMLVRSEPGRAGELRAALRERLRQPGQHAQIQSVREEARDRAAPVGSVIGILSAMVSTIVFVVLIGSMGLTYFLVARRTREIGVRRAMGASRRDVIRHFLVENLILTVAGAVIGLAIVAVALPALIRQQEDFVIKWPLVVLAVTAVVVMNLIATLIPASKAATVPPVVASRTT